MISDQTLKNAVKKYDNTTEYEAILYVSLEGGVGDIITAAGVGMVLGHALVKTVGVGVGGALGGMSNDWAIMTVNDENLYFYVLDKFKTTLKIVNKIVLPCEKVVKLKIGKFLIWNSLKIYFVDTSNRKKKKIKVSISDKVMGIKEQKENVRILLDYIKTKG